MKAVLNPLLEQTSFDSAAPSGTAAVVHKFDEPGEYQVVFLQEDATIGRSFLTIAAEVPQGTVLDSVTFDLKKIEYPAVMGGPAVHADPVLLRPSGHVSFTATGKPKTYAVVAEPRNKGKGGRFDSRRLEQGDVFVVTPLRPGHYRLVNTHGGSDGRIRVLYPVIGDKPYRPPEPLIVEVRDGGFAPNTIELSPAQGIVFQIRCSARIKIDLEKPDDGPPDRAQRRFGLSPRVTPDMLERVREARKKREADKEKSRKQ